MVSFKIKTKITLLCLVLGRTFVPNAFQVHGSDLHHMTDLLALENAVSSSSSHASHVEKFGSVNHMVI